MLAFFGEFFGTFVFVSVILQATAKNAKWPLLAPFMIILGLLAGIVISVNASGAHLNPAVSTVMYLDRALSTTEFGTYVSAQVLGAVSAYFVKTYMDGLVSRIV